MADDIPKEDHSYNATREERSRNERSWRLVLNAEGAQGPLDQRDDHKQAKETCNKMCKEHAATAECGNAPFQPQQQVRQRSNQQFEGYEEDSYRLDSSVGGVMFSQMHSSPSSSSSWWEKSDSWWAWNWATSSWSEQCFFSFQMKHFVCPKCNLLAIDGDVISTPTAHTFFSCAVCQRSCPSLLSQFVLQIVTHLVIDSTHTRGSSTT